MSIGSILSIARSAISAHQVAMQTVSQNIANAEIEGYSRQRAEMVTATPVRFTHYSLGSGVDVQGVVRLRDQLLDASFRRESGNLESSNTRTELLGEIEAVLGEPSETGLAKPGSVLEFVERPGQQSRQCHRAERGTSARAAGGLHAQ